ncbi:MAG: P-loop NTPase [Desulfobacterales bacterium]|nr:P-loop NTPase [Desulfobacterales bacterium]
MSIVITVTSWKKNAGKTNVSVNLALSLAGQGQRVCLVGGDSGFVNLFLRLSPEYNLEDMLAGECSLEDIIIRDYHGIDIIPAGPGIEMVSELESDKRKMLAKSFAEINHYDYFIIDAAAGTSPANMALCLASPELILLTTPEHAALDDAYTIIKMLAHNNYDGSVMLLANRSENKTSARSSQSRLIEFVGMTMDVKMIQLGAILDDPKVDEAIEEQTPYFWQYPDSEASRCLKNITKNIMKNRDEEINGFDHFWKALTEINLDTLKLSALEHSELLKNSGLHAAGIFGNEKLPLSGAKTDSSEERISPDLAILSQIAENMGSISKELGAIKKILADHSAEYGVHDEVYGVLQQREKDSVSNLIPLNFEAFLERHKGRTEEK